MNAKQYRDGYKKRLLHTEFKKEDPIAFRMDTINGEYVEVKIYRKRKTVGDTLIALTVIPRPSHIK